MLYKRVLVAVIGIPVALPILIFAPHFVVFLLLMAIAGIALSEYYGMAFPENTNIRRFCIAIGALVYLLWGMGVVFELPDSIFHAPLVFGFLALFIFFLFNYGEIQTAASRTAIGVLGLIYIDVLFFFPFMLQVTPDPAGWKLVLFLLAVVWMNDTGGYFAGRYLGKHKFYEAVSPKKTWEGSVGGALAGIGGAFAFDAMLSLNWPALHLIVLSLIMGYVGQVGDLCESLLKRSFGIKDSGTIIPGHGGVLDRFDAVLFASPVLYYYFNWFLA